MRLTIHHGLPIAHGIRARGRVRDPDPITIGPSESSSGDPRFEDDNGTTDPMSTALDPGPGRAPARHRRIWTAGLTVAGLTAVLVVCPAIAHAETMNIAIAASFSAVLDNIRNWLIGILGGIATVFLTIGGVRRTMAGGDPGEHEKAKEAFKAAGIGYGLAAVAPLVVEALKGIVGL